MIVLFFFQAEDGIRDGRVTGVQTCALPIFTGDAEKKNSQTEENDIAPDRMGLDIGPKTVDLFVEQIKKAKLVLRSEERRVGKECRSRWSPNDERKKEKTGD